MTEPVLPSTRGSLARQLRDLGVRAGSATIVHSSLKSLGFVVGDVEAVVLALLDALGPEGTLVVPTHTPGNSDPADWQNPPVPEPWWPIIREHAPGFDPMTTASRWMGRLPEAVRCWPGALRSNHPYVSFAALGARAAEIVDGHRLDDMLGWSSPLGRIHRLDGDVLLLGVDHGSNTSLHLAEHLLPEPPRDKHGASVRGADGASAWVLWEDVVADEDDFGRLGEDFDATGDVRIGPVGAATARLMSQQRLIEYGATWLTTERSR